MAPVHYHAGRFPPRHLDWPTLTPLIGPATAMIARGDGMLSAAPNSSILLAPLATREAVLSSRIEGTQATVGDVLRFEAGGAAASAERRSDIIEVVNYRKAMRRAEEMLEKIPLSGRVVREAHRILLSGVRGAARMPGEFRRNQNWIGPPGCKMGEAKFIPIAPNHLPNALRDWERHIHADSPDLLVQAAILHAEFEALHPFQDGNGRIGRMLIPMFLWQREMIHRPLFYISAYFEANRAAYYERLLAVSRDDDWTGWCAFFLKAVRAQAEENMAKIRAIFALHERMKRRIPEVTRSRHAIRVLDWIFERPMFRRSDFVRRAGFAEISARHLLEALVEDEILTFLAPGRGSRSAILGFPELLKIAEE